MAQEFVSDPSDEPNTPATSTTSDTAPSDRQKLRHILIGSPKVVRSTIHLLHVLGYAEATDWSPLQSTANPGETISILVRYSLRE